MTKDYIYKMRKEHESHATHKPSVERVSAGVSSIYAKRGYGLISTGGNCTGMYRKFRDSGTHILVTDGDNFAPSDLKAPVCAGLYAENGLWIATMEAGNSAELFRKIAAGDWTPCAS